MAQCEMELSDERERKTKKKKQSPGKIRRSKKFSAQALYILNIHDTKVFSVMSYNYMFLALYSLKSFFLSLSLCFDCFSCLPHSYRLAQSISPSSSCCLTFWSRACCCDLFKLLSETSHSCWDFRFWHVDFFFRRHFLLLLFVLVSCHFLCNCFDLKQIHFSARPSFGHRSAPLGYRIIITSMMPIAVCEYIFQLISG